MYRIFFVVLLSLYFLFLGGCSWNKPKYIDTAIKRPELFVAEPRPLQLESIYWNVISDKNLSDWAKKLRNEKEALFCLSSEDYKDISINTQKLMNYIQSQKNVIDAYREYYELGDKEKSK